MGRRAKRKEQILCIIGISGFIAAFILSPDIHISSQYEVSNVLHDKNLNDLSIPPDFTDSMNDPSQYIKTKMSADELDSSCKTANEYMDKNIEAKIIGGHRVDIFEYMESCKYASKRTFEMIQPHAKKWCHYKELDKRFGALCNDWELNGPGYLKQIDQNYEITLKRFQSITHGYYKDRPGIK